MLTCAKLCTQRHTRSLAHALWTRLELLVACQPVPHASMEHHSRACAAGSSPLPFPRLPERLAASIPAAARLTSQPSVVSLLQLPKPRRQKNVVEQKPLAQVLRTALGGWVQLLPQAPQLSMLASVQVCTGASKGAWSVSPSCNTPGVCCRRLVADGEGQRVRWCTLHHLATPHQGMPCPMHIRQHHSSAAPHSSARPTKRRCCQVSPPHPPTPWFTRDGRAQGSHNPGLLGARQQTVTSCQMSVPGPPGWTPCSWLAPQKQTPACHPAALTSQPSLNRPLQLP